jgi:hypothetical protein
MHLDTPEKSTGRPQSRVGSTAREALEGRKFTKLEQALLRQTAYSIDQMAPGGVERADAGVIRLGDIARATERLRGLLANPLTQRDEAKRKALQLILERAERFETLIKTDGSDGIRYLDDREFALKSPLRGTAIEIDFCFGDRDGRVSEEDILAARRQYQLVRGPVGWNRLLVTDEVEKRLFPERTLQSSYGPKLLLRDWMTPSSSEPLRHLQELIRTLDDDGVARTYADIAARLGTVANPTTGTDPSLAPTLEGALTLLAEAIRSRKSCKPTLTDIARVGCEDPDVRAMLTSPIEMSKRLRTQDLLERFLWK